MRMHGKAEGRTVKRLIRDGFFADVITSSHREQQTFNWIVQSADSNDVVELGQEPTLKSAEQQAKQRLAEVVKRSKNRIVRS